MDDDDDRIYKMIGGNATRLCIIVTDYNKNIDKEWQMMATDLSNILELVQNLGFIEDNILIIENKTYQVISKMITEFCVRDKIKVRDYIMLFILAYRSDRNTYRIAKNEKCEFGKFKENFVANTLEPWAVKPKLIFHQAPFLKPFSTTDDDRTNAAKDSINKTNQFYLPITTNIMELFACIGNQESYGNAAGSFYIQALCQVFNAHIKEDTIYKKYLSELMYEVHAKVKEFVAELKEAEPDVVRGDQTPYIKSTFVKNFVFPK